MYNRQREKVRVEFAVSSSRGNAIVIDRNADAFASLARNDGRRLDDNDNDITLRDRLSLPRESVKRIP